MSAFLVRIIQADDCSEGHFRRKISIQIIVLKCSALLSFFSGITQPNEFRSQAKLSLWMTRLSTSSAQSMQVGFCLAAGPVQAVTK